jgi:hypothetical protein
LAVQEGARGEEVMIELSLEDEKTLSSKEEKTDLSKDQGHSVQRTCDEREQDTFRKPKEDMSEAGGVAQVEYLPSKHEALS